MQLLLLSVTIGLLHQAKNVLTDEQPDNQDAIKLEKLYQATFSEESIARMAASVEATTPRSILLGGGVAGESSIQEEGADEDALSSENIVTFHLFTRSNPKDDYPLAVDDTDNLEQSPFNSELPIKVLIHGWQSTVSEPWVKNITENYFTIGEYNIIGVDWSIWSMKDYITAEGSTRSVGERTAKLLEYLKTAANMSFNDVHILGHSLGAHAAGFAGANVSGAFSRITGMDPAGPLYEVPEMKPPSERLDSTDAIFVDVIHTCGGVVGFFGAIGHADFYPNGGTCNQPGCALLALTCSHSRSHDYMVDSIIHPDEFVAVRCGSLQNYNYGKCSGATRAIMGNNVNPNSQGVFYLSTNAESPYGKGSNPKSSGADYGKSSIIFTVLSIIFIKMYPAYTT